MLPRPCNKALPIHCWPAFPVNGTLLFPLNKCSPNCLANNSRTIWRRTYRSEELRGGDGRAVAVQLDATAQVKVTDLDWGNLTKRDRFRILNMNHILISRAHYNSLYQGVVLSTNWAGTHVVNSPCLHSYRGCFQVWGLYAPFLEKNREAISNILNIRPPC